MKFNRRSLVLGASAGVLASPFIRLRPANAAEFTMKLANNQPLEHPTNIRAAEAVKAIAEQSDGRVDVQVFPSNQLGADTDVLSQLRAGGVEFFLLSPVILSTLVPNASINGIGFAFPDYDAVWKAMDGELGAYERGQIEDAGLVVMEKIWDNGFRQTTTSTKPIEGPADLEGFKIRVPVSPLWTSMFTAFGSAPTSINFAEVYTALQTGVVDGQENPLAIIKVAKMWEVQKYVSMTNHMWDGFWMLANRRAWGALPEDLQQIVAENFNKAGMEQRQDVMQLNADLRGELEGQGLVFNDVDPKPFEDKLREAGFYAEWKKTYGDEAWAILESAVGRTL
ncbi:MAG: TRAP transporter substrate-binding protein [Paracoccus sp. (in: a-proteobacteria)]|uniref:TRAP transporter substrate-binding protein n=3 Tax=Paracoccus sp. TaxID=267 RepID=UPI000C692CA5|nr:TRAP transporter substrate-binding protein [Paracoccus sp. (in: a-proteobacteria)]MAN55172.1 ABC transporter substrate-binding protein [Paracoccus sp. (in: a-proteobacteria)]MBA47952.1 ABC transporter substrate-binding protein [Paracoccus sp. (in: a-proteobacteria)]